MSSREPLPEEIRLTRGEAAQILFALDAALEVVPQEEVVRVQVEDAARILVERFLPDLPDL